METAKLRARAQEVLRRMGPLTAQELAPRVVSDGEEAPDPGWLFTLLLDDSVEEFTAFPLDDRRLADLDHLLDGVTLTHVLDGDERDGDYLTLDPDLTPLIVLSPDGRRVPLADGSSALFRDGFERLLLPPDWLPDAEVAVVRFRDGAAEVQGTEDLPPIDDVTVERLARTFAAIDTGPYPVDASELLIETLARTPRLFDEVRAPLGQLLRAADIGVGDEGQLFDLADDLDGDPADSDPDDELVEHLQVDHGLSEDQAAAVLHLMLQVEELEAHVTETIVDRMAQAGEAPLPEDTVQVATEIDDPTDWLATVLADTHSTLAVAKDVVGSQRRSAIVLLTLLDHAGQLRGRRLRANLHWLRGRLLELVEDDHTTAEREFRRARDLDEDHAEATFDLVGYLSDRGQAGAALSLLADIEGPGVADWTSQLDRYARPGPATAGRNDPCPCESGRKHKICCARRNGWPLTDRIEWLWNKVVRFSIRPGMRSFIVPVALAARADDPGPAAMQDAVVANLVLFEHGLLTEFCDRRGALLPADELDLVRGWSQVRAGAYEAVEVDPGNGVVLLDLTSGDRIATADRSLSRQVSDGDTVLAWIVDDPDGPSPAGGGVQVPDRQVRPLLDLLDSDPTAEQMAGWYASLSAPPALRTTDGDPLVPTTMTYRVDDPGASRAALATRLESDGDVFTAVVEDDTAHRWVRGSVEVDGDTLTVSTNSASRAAWFKDLVAKLVPDAVLVDEESIPAGDLLAADDEDGDDEDGDDAFDVDQLSPDELVELEGELDAMMAAHEDAWVDTELPALGGVTPRAAADDPTRRDDLRRLLDDIAEHAQHWDSPGRPMDADRLARLLGL